VLGLRCRLDRARRLEVPGARLVHLHRRTIAEAAQGDLWNVRGPLPRLHSRGLPIDDIAWLHENDFGTLPGNLPVSRICAKATKLFDEWESDRCAEADAILKKLGRKAKVKVDEINAHIETERDLLEQTCKFLPALNSDEWVQAVCYIYRDATSTPVSINIRQWQSEDEDRKKKIMRLQPRPNRRDLFGVSVTSTK
jgi:hypothetical protein